MRRTLPVALGLIGLASVVHAGDTTRAPSSGAAIVSKPGAAGRGGTIVATPRGPLVAERHAATVVRTDAAGNPVARLELGGELGELVHDGHARAWVAERGSDRIVEVTDGDALQIARTVAVAEPFGLALSPDGKTLLATSVAEQSLVAIATDDLSVRWSVRLAAEPRGVAISADGSEAVVGLLSRASLAVVDLDGAAPKVRWQSLDPRDQVVVVEDELGDGEKFVDIREAPSRFRVPQGAGRRHVRNSFAVGYLGDGRAITTHQLATPQLVHKPDEGEEDSYGGARVEMPPVVHRISWIREPGRVGARHSSAVIDVHQPRAFGYDDATDTLFVGGYGDDRVVAIADASSEAPWPKWSTKLDRKEAACGIDGMVVDGNALRVHCELSRRVLSLPLRHDVTDDRKLGKLAVRGPELAPSRRSAQVEHGAELFRRAGDGRLSGSGFLACATCHPEGRADGLTWRLGEHVLQTPMLAGRVVGTAPYKWDGQDESLFASVRHTINRIGGDSTFVERREIDALVAYMSSLDDPQAPAVVDAAAHARGRALFEDKTLGCASCHGGSKLTDTAQYPLKSPLPQTDTPSLVGLAHSVPYYHDGSADSLHALLTDRGSVHDMAELGGLSDAQVDDLRIYLESL
jgi:hypothetical protein